MLLLWQSVARTRHKLEQLRHREQKVEYLRYEEEEEKLAEVSENADDGERHACKVAECVADKHLARIPIVDEQRQCARDEWYYQIHGEYVVVSVWSLKN